MKKTSLIASALILLTACGGGQSVDDLIQSADQDALKAKKTEISGTISQLEADLELIENALETQTGIKKLPLVTTIKVNEKLFKHYVEVQGTVSTDQDVVIYPEMQGVLKSINANMGDEVKSGQTIATIDDGGMREQLAQAREQLKLAKMTYERQKRLWDKEIGSEMDFLQAETSYNSLVAQVEQLEKTLARSVVSAPYSGIIDEVTAELGQLMVPGQTPVLRLVNLDNMYIKADLPESYLPNIEIGKDVVVTLNVLGEEVDAKVSKVGSYIKPSNRTFLIEVDLPNKDRKIKPNLTARLKINDYTNEKAIMIPQAIINEDSNGNQYVYRVNTKGSSNMVEKVNIKTGKKNSESIEVLSGLSNGDQLVEEGARVVKNGQEVKVIK